MFNTAATDSSRKSSAYLMLALLLIGLALAWICVWHTVAGCPFSSGHGLCQTICAGSGSGTTYVVVFELLFLIPLTFILRLFTAKEIVAAGQEHGALAEPSRLFRPPKPV